MADIIIYSLFTFTTVLSVCNLYCVENLTYVIPINFRKLEPNYRHLKDCISKILCGPNNQEHLLDRVWKRNRYKSCCEYARRSERVRRTFRRCR